MFNSLPVNSDTRNKIIKSLGVDIEIIDNYYTGKELAFQVLKKYVKYGSDLLFNPELRQQVLGVKEVTPQISDLLKQIVVDVSNELEFPQEEKKLKR